MGNPIILDVSPHVGVGDIDKDAGTSGSILGLTGEAFTVADISLKPPQAIAILSAGSVEDVFGQFRHVERIDGFINIDGVDYDLRTNKKRTGNDWTETQDANILMYTDDNNNYILQFNGKLIHIEGAVETGMLFFNSIESCIITPYDSLANSEEFVKFAESMGIDEHTVLGAKIILKLYMAGLDYNMSQLDEACMDLQAEYLAFINTTLTPIIEATLTATMSALKSAVEFLKRIVQKSGA